jgi:anaerobic ribonucleoside-triphosphate reductase activating protein
MDILGILKLKENLVLIKLNLLKLKKEKVCKERLVMNYHSIFYDDMKNGEGLRVTLFVSGCSHNCKGCHNPVTHDPNSGELFDENALNRIRKHLDHEYIDGITLSGGDPLYYYNREDINNLIDIIKKEFPTKTIWLYTGYSFEEIMQDSELKEIVSKVDVVVDGKFIIDKLDANYPWAGSTNQSVINVQESIKAYPEIILIKEDNVEEETNKILFK